MVDLLAIQAAISSLQAAGDIAKTFIGLRDAAAIQAKTIELQRLILEAQSSAIRAQSEQSSFLDHIRELERQVQEIQAWNVEKQKYHLTEIEPGQFAYTLTQQTGSTEPQHMLCANCYNHNTKSILQRETRYPGRHTVFVCQNCGGEIFSESTGGRSEQHIRPQVITKRPKK
jgi:hypothetical protein